MNQKFFRARLAFSKLLILMLSCLTLASAPLTVENPSEITKKVDALFAQYDKPNSPGCALGVIRDGRLIYARGYGLANLEHNIPISSKTVFDIGSTSKQFAAASILLLAQQGKLSLDDDIRKLIPEIPAYDQKITIRHLLHHTSGLRDYLTLMSLAGTDFNGVTTDDDALRLLARQKEINFTPGAEHLYSNSGYFLLSVIVRRASGKRLRQFAHEHIFAPLGMKHTHFHDDHTMIVPLRATGYSPKENGEFGIEMSNFEQTGDGAVFTTIEDLLLWDQNFYQPKVGGRELLDQFLIQGKLNSGEQLKYASGLYVGEHRGLKMISHGGAWAGYRAELIRFPAERLSVACLCNVDSSNPSGLATQVAELYLSNKLKPENPTSASASTAPASSVKLSPQELAQKTGTFRDQTTGALWKVTAANGNLVVDASVITLHAVPISNMQFRAVNAPADINITFDNREPGKPLLMRVQIETDEPMVFEAISPPVLTPAQLAEYVGDYYSDELQALYRIAMEDGKLFLRLANKDTELSKKPFQPSLRDAFSVRGLSLNFVRDGQDKISHFTVNTGRVKNIKFLRR
ncbi:MAG: beta-lactamase family protein [Acidobacteriota bacterium]|nr:beta-lactamase family protein [Acidobacteriota bacterium]